MANQPCPNSEVCCGTLQLHPDVTLEEEHEIINGRECITSITVTCCLIAECSNCSHVEIVDHERRSFTFDQFYHPNEPFPDLLAELEEMHTLHQETNYVE